MNFDFSDDQKHARAAQEIPRRKVPDQGRAPVLDGNEAHDKEVWKGLAEIGVLGVGIPETFGGAAAHLELCVIAEEIGRAIAPVPFDSSVVPRDRGADARGLRRAEEEVAAEDRGGEAIGTLAVSEGAGAPCRRHQRTTSGGTLNGEKKPVADGEIADFAVVAARTGLEGRDPDLSLVLVDLKVTGARRVETNSIRREAGRTHLQAARRSLSGRTAKAGASSPGCSTAPRCCYAFEQVGGAHVRWRWPRLRDGALRLRPRDRLVSGDQAHARRHVRDRRAGGLELLLRGVGAFDRRGASCRSRPRPRASRRPRRSSSAAKDNIQVHGGMGFTWEFDCHLYYRRANFLALTLGGLSVWEDPLVDRLAEERDVAHPDGAAARGTGPAWTQRRHGTPSAPRSARNDRGKLWI